MPVTATLKLVLRDLPETREKDGLVYMALQNEPRGLPKGISLDSGPLYLSSPVKQWKAACSKAEQIRATGTPALLIVEAHISTKAGVLVGVVKGVQVVEGKAAGQPQAMSTAPASAASTLVFNASRSMSSASSSPRESRSATRRGRRSGCRRPSARE